MQIRGRRDPTDAAVLEFLTRIGGVATDPFAAAASAFLAKADAAGTETGHINPKAVSAPTTPETALDRARTLVVFPEVFMYLYQNFDLPSQGKAHGRLSRFLLEHASGLVFAASLLGGRAGGRRTAALIESIPGADVLTRRHLAEVAALFRLLSLQNVHVADSIEAACFAEIAPSSPVVDEICLLTDRLSGLLQAVAEEADRPAVADA